jgi:hypothetical protein
MSQLRNIKKNQSATKATTTTKRDNFIIYLSSQFGL